MEWIEETIKNPDYAEVQLDRRIRKWKKIREEGKSLRIISFSFLTGWKVPFKIKLGKGGEVHEMDVPPCNTLFDLRFDTLVLSMT
jgi:hypothetical protein